MRQMIKFLIRRISVYFFAIDHIQDVISYYAVTDPCRRSIQALKLFPIAKFDAFFIMRQDLPLGANRQSITHRGAKRLCPKALTADHGRASTCEAHQKQHHQT